MQMDQLNEVVGTTGNDPQLDSLIIRFHTETSPPRWRPGSTTLWGAKTWLNMSDLRITLLQARTR
ncbi:hypothetical protein BBK82_36090 [Lentzea guizhouensis]|uniref:Uncharacterized protein n=2 Tax=Lentzea guizhouensis TaxID=1586287 RepID=A0A1B2HSE7_9PSEU|nr:hypothetical protein BBK82_36090 [Lentzea guizhouensis]